MGSFLQFIFSNSPIIIFSKFCLFYFFAWSNVGRIVKSISSAICKLFRTRLKKIKKKQKVNKILKFFFGEFEYFGGSDVANKLFYAKKHIISRRKDRNTKVKRFDACLCMPYLGLKKFFKAINKCQKCVGKSRLGCISLHKSINCSNLSDRARNLSLSFILSMVHWVLGSYGFHWCGFHSCLKNFLKCILCSNLKSKD